MQLPDLLEANHMDTLKNESIEKNMNKFQGFITLMKHITVLALSLLGELPEDVAYFVNRGCEQTRNGLEGLKLQVNQD